MALGQPQPNKGKSKMNRNHDDNDYSDFVGAKVRTNTMFLLGKIKEIKQYRDGYGHTISVAVTDRGSEINCRRFFDDLLVTR